MSLLETAGQWRIERNHNNQALTQAIFEMRARGRNIDGNLKIGSYNARAIVGEFFLDNPDLSDEQLIQISQIIKDKLEPEPLNPEAASKLSHQFAVDVWYILTGISQDWLSLNLPGLGCTGRGYACVWLEDLYASESFSQQAKEDLTRFLKDVLKSDEDINYFNPLAELIDYIFSDSPETLQSMILGTIVHDTTDILQQSGIEGLNQAFYGHPSSEVSAIRMIVKAIIEAKKRRWSYSSSRILRFVLLHC